MSWVLVVTNCNIDVNSRGVALSKINGSPSFPFPFPLKWFLPHGAGSTGCWYQQQVSLGEGAQPTPGCGMLQVTGCCSPFLGIAWKKEKTLSFPATQWWEVTGRRCLFDFQPEPFSSLPVLSICRILSPKTPSLLHLPFPPKKDRLWDRHKPEHQEGAAAFSLLLLPPPQQILNTMVLNIQNPAFFIVNRSLWSLTFCLPYTSLRHPQPGISQVELRYSWLVFAILGCLNQYSLPPRISIPHPSPHIPEQPLRAKGVFMELSFPWGWKSQRESPQLSLCQCCQSQTVRLRGRSWTFLPGSCQTSRK